MAHRARPMEDEAPRYLRAPVPLIFPEEAGVRQLVRFDARGEKPSLRAWDRVDGDLVERLVVDGRAPSLLGLAFVVGAADGLAPALRLARPDGSLVLTRAEARRAETEAREAAERRIAELEAELARRSTLLTSRRARRLSGSHEPRRLVRNASGRHQARRT